MHKPKRILNIPIKYPNTDDLDTTGEFVSGVIEASINIDDSLSDEETKVVLAHELMHYAIWKSGFDRVLKSLGCDTDALEEGIVSCIQQQLVATDVLIVNPKYFKKGK